MFDAEHMQDGRSDANDMQEMQEHGNGCRIDVLVCAANDLRDGRIPSSCVLLQYHQITRETCRRVGEIR